MATVAFSKGGGVVNAGFSNTGHSMSRTAFLISWSAMSSPFDRSIVCGAGVPRLLYQQACGYSNLFPPPARTSRGISCSYIRRRIRRNVNERSGWATGRSSKKIQFIVQRTGCSTANCTKISNISRISSLLTLTCHCGVLNFTVHMYFSSQGVQ